MVQSLSKFSGIWLGVALLLGAVLFFTSGSPSSINPEVEATRLAACQGADGGFSGNQEQECLTQVERTLATLAVEVRSDLMFWHAMSALAVLLLGLLFMVQINQRATSASTPSEFRSMRGPWLGYVMAIGAVTLIFAVLSHFGAFFGAWAGIVSPARGWGIPALMVVVWCATFWLGSRSGTPDKMKPSIPGA